MAPGLGQDPSHRAAGPCWPKGHSMALHAQLQQKRVRGSQGCPALGAPEALLCPAPLRQRRPTPHLAPVRPPARRNQLRAPARPTTPHHLPQRAGAKQLTPARYGAAPARRRTAGAPPAPPLFPGQREIEVLRPVRCWRTRRAGGLFLLGPSPSYLRGAGSLLHGLVMLG